MSNDQAHWGDRYLAAMRWAIPPALREDAPLMARAQNVVNAAMIAGLSGPLYALAYHCLGFHAAAREILLCCALMLCAPPVLRFSGSIAAARELFLGAVLFNFSWLSYHLGGVTAPTAAWLLTAPMVAMFLGGVRTALCWLAASCAALCALYATRDGAPSVGQLPHMPTLHLLCGVGLLVVVTVFVLLFELTKTKGFVHLEQALRTINELAIRDELTGIHNRRHLLRLIERERALGRHFSLCLLDIDFFKRINDTYGHAAGDAVLRTFARTVQSQVRPGDTFGRYGGEEFLLMLPDTPASSALVLAERVRLAIEQMRYAEIGSGVAVTASIGVAECRPGESVAQVIGRSDEALYLAKAAGRNQVACHGNTAGTLAPAPASQDGPAPPTASRHDTDELTGLPGRRMLTARLQQAMQRALPNHRPLALLLINIDRFREMNDTLGVAAGDALLVRSATLLRGAIREGDVVARWGDDEFIVVLEDVGGEAEARQVAAKITERFAAPLPLDGVAAGRRCYVTLSVGMALFPGSDCGLDALLGQAGRALAQARTSAGHSIALANAGNACQDDGPALRDGLRAALAQQQLRIDYRPRVDLATRRITGVDALPCWQHPHDGHIARDRFLDLAEETGLILPIGDWLLRGACLQQRAWASAGLPAVQVSVRMSARQLREPALAARVLRIVAETGIAPRCVELEIPEGALADDLAHKRSTLDALRAAGMQIVLGKFGTAYSSLQYLSDLPVDILKLDGSFVRRLDGAGARGWTIAEAIVSIAHKLALTVIAEDVETALQSAALVQLGCDQAQGAAFHRIMPAEAVAALLLRSRPRLVAGHGVALHDTVELRLV